MGKSQGKKSINKEEICEDCCFKCKDGGFLRICDYKDCLKAYHPKCVEKDDWFLESEVPWTCSWHSCFSCKRAPKFHCFCCPNAVCGICLNDFQFAVIGSKGGLCSHCFQLARLLEGSKDPDLHQGEIDFNDKDTYEYFFKYYWTMVKKKKGLSSAHVSNAIEQHNMKGLSSAHVSNAIEQHNMVKNSKDVQYSSATEDSNEVEDEYETESSNDHSNNTKRRKKLSKRRRTPSRTRRTGNYKEKEFSGWASSLLVDFLVSIGKDTTELSQNDVNTIVLQYCIDNKLFDAVKKKKVVCDERLKSLFRRKSFFKNSIYKLLTPHFAENLEQLLESESEYDSENKNKRALITYKRKRCSSSKSEPRKNEAIDLDEQQQGCFASMIAQNIKCLYLNRSLIEELLEQPETFEEKVVGTFVRIKSDPYDYMQKNSHMLVKVTGVKKISGNEVTKDILLQVSNMRKDIPIYQLSNDNFSEEECEDLRQRVKDGRLERTSIVELKEKTRSLHEVITKQWIAKELYRLEKLIDQANEKGWRRQLVGYVERKQLLERPSEQERLLAEFPEIIADKTEAEHADQQYSMMHEEENARLPEPNSRELSKPSTKNLGCDAADFAEHEKQCQIPESVELEQRNPTVSNEPVIIEENEEPPESPHHTLASERQPVAVQPNSILPKRLENKQSGAGMEFIEISDNEERDNSFDAMKKIVEISDSDGEEEDDDTIGVSKKIEDDSSDCEWYCMSEHGIKAGPYSMSLLKQWTHTLPNEIRFKVWKANQSPDEAIPLRDAVRQFSSKE